MKDMIDEATYQRLEKDVTAVKSDIADLAGQIIGLRLSHAMELQARDARIAGLIRSSGAGGAQPKGLRASVWGCVRLSRSASTGCEVPAGARVNLTHAAAALQARVAAARSTFHAATM